MSESAGLTLISTQIQSTTGFSSSNVAIAKWGLLNSGKSDHYAILKPGRSPRTQLTFTIKDDEYRTVIEVWQRYKDDGTSLTTLLGHVENIVDRIDKYRKLADTTGSIRDANVTELGEVVERWTKDGGVGWLSRDVVVTWQEEENISYAE